MDQASDQNASWTPPSRGFPSNLEETTGQTKNMLTGLHILSN